ncbi:hypothetical protein N0V82_003746 [Gnomoniopsis sp. IMI 355080]|nr:hypothetical protein N0V82_003746 [Gnomoniopsis sp. IMI 355080]
MAVFVDLDDDDVDLPQHGLNAMKPVWNSTAPSEPSTDAATARDEDVGNNHRMPSDPTFDDKNKNTHRNDAAHEPAVQEPPNSMAVALGCYPIVTAMASQLDLNDVDSLSRTCRGVHNSLLQNRSILLKSTLHCTYEELPVDPESTLRYRARAGNWYYMEDTSRSAQYNGKSGSCARDMVSECRKCGTVVCRNCAIKPPAPAVLRDRHRHSEYRGIWKWRTQYGEVLGGLGTGIGDADRGVECARGKDCLSGKYIEHETDCDADDAREAEDLAAGHPSPGTQTLSLYSGSHSWSSSHSSLHGSIGSTSGGLLDSAVASGTSRTPSPAVGPGYARHEVEGIGNKIKTVRVSMIRVGGCVPEWKDEKSLNQSLRREVEGEVRSWCGWCDRVIPGKMDIEADEKQSTSTTTHAS